MNENISRRCNLTFEALSSLLSRELVRREKSSVLRDCVINNLFTYLCRRERLPGTDTTTDTNRVMYKIYLILRIPLRN